MEKSMEVRAETPVHFVTQSKFFVPEFNAAIFDGPIRIYFAQDQEAQALKVYFNLQERFGEIRRAARGPFRHRGRSVFVLLYPTIPAFEMSFGVANEGDVAEASAAVVSTRLGDDYVIGVRGQLEDGPLEAMYLAMDAIVRGGDSDASTPAPLEAAL